METVYKIIGWGKERLAERSTWDGGVIVIISVAALVAAPIMPYLAYAGIGYGVFRILENQSKLFKF